MRRALVILACALAVTLGACAPLPPPEQQGAPPVPVPTPSRPAPPPRYDTEPMVEVGLVWTADTLSFDPAGKELSWRTGRSHDRAQGRAEGLLVTVESGRAALRGLGDVRPIATFAASDTLWVGEPTEGDPEPEPQLAWNRKTWRGQAKVLLNPRGQLTLALRLPLETYLLGVVPGEIGALGENLLQAGRAQAIAARSYTLYYRGRRAGEGFDLYGTVEDQVYGPVESERPLATRCVASTRGQLAEYGGAPIRANYCSTCGGITADVWEGFPAQGFPYLASRRDVESARGGADFCAGSTQYRWREEWRAADFLATISKYAPAEGIALPAQGLGELLDARVDTRSRSGRVWRLEIATTTGTLVVPAYSLRRVLRRPGSTSILRSNLFKIDVRRDAATRRARAVVVSGAGSGHGVGLCQTGALGMARAGHTGEQILAHYYPGIEVKKRY